MKKYRIREGSIAARFVGHADKIKEWAFIIFMLGFLFLGIPTLVWIGECAADAMLAIF